MIAQAIEESVPPVTTPPVPVGSAAGRSHITSLRITSRVSPAFGGRRFGTVGQYEWLLGQAEGVADPASLRNAPVSDLALGPRDAQGLVHYRMDVAILKPIDPARANGTLIYEAVDHGRPRLMPLLWRGAGVGESVGDSAGTGAALGLAEGFTMVWSGWQVDVAPSSGSPAQPAGQPAQPAGQPTRPAAQPALSAGRPDGGLLPAGADLLRADFPVVRAADGSPLTGRVHDEFQLDGVDQPAPPSADGGASFDAGLSFPLAAGDLSGVRVTVRANAEASPAELPPGMTTLLGPRSLRIRRAQGFDQGALYEVSYVAKDPVLTGLGFVSVRDLVSFLRGAATGDDGAPNPLRDGASGDGGSRIRRAIAIGGAQGGRFLRDFVYRDFNVDDAGRPVFDGMLVQGTGAMRGFFTGRFAQPGRPAGTQHAGPGYPGAQFPFTYATLTDAVTHRTDGILARCTVSRSCPKIMHLDDDWAQWQQAGSLVVTDTAGRPIALPDDVRAYYLAGAPHRPGPGIARPEEGRPGACAFTPNRLDWSPVFRALVVDLQAWVAEGTAPPASRYPASADEGRITIAQLQRGFPGIPGYPFNPAFGGLAGPYPLSVIRVDRDGNPDPRDGVLMPELAAPIATYSGRNTRADGFAPGDLCGTRGAAIPFIRSVNARIASGDRRLALEERYRSLADYRSRLRAAALRLQAQRLMLPADVEAYSSYELPR